MDDRPESTEFIQNRKIDRTRSALCICLGLLVLLTIKFIYDEISHRMAIREEASDLKLKLESCTKDKWGKHLAPCVYVFQNYIIRQYPFLFVRFQ